MKGDVGPGRAHRILTNQLRIMRGLRDLLAAARLHPGQSAPRPASLSTEENGLDLGPEAPETVTRLVRDFVTGLPAYAMITQVREIR